MSDTPETDKQRAYSIVYSDATVPADFARKLELLYQQLHRRQIRQYRRTHRPRLGGRNSAL